MRSILLIHKPHYRQRRSVHERRTDIAEDVSCEERSSDLPGRWKHVTCFVIVRKDTRLADWRWRQYSRSLCDALPATLQSTKTPLPTTRPGLQSRDCSHSRREFWRTHFRPSWSVKRRDLLRDWSEGHAIGWLDMMSEVAFFSWPAGCCFKSREAWASALWRWYSWPVWSRFIFSAGCTLKPVSWPSTALTTDTSAGSIRVGLRVFWRNLQNSSLASDEKKLELGWCDWCFTAEKSVPVRSEEMHLWWGIPSIHSFQLRRLKLSCSTRRRFYGDCSWKVIDETFKQKRHG